MIATSMVLFAAIVFFVSGDDQDRAIVDQLARQQAESAPPVSLDSASSRFQPDMFHLTPLVNAERSSQRNSWTIRQGQNDTFIQLPFMPSRDGVLPQNNLADEPPTQTSSNPGFMGAAACAECHRERHESFVHTAHHKTSGEVSAQYSFGQFTSPQNRITTSDPSLSFQMNKRDGRRFQKVSLADWNLEFPLDVFTGSAKAGQTFLYWHDDALFQTYVSYLSKFDEWIPSPGYHETAVDYSRPIRTECLECHITYIESKRRPNVYHRDSAVWGISCERCHGPGRRHVEFHRDHPEEQTGQHIVHPSDLPRRRQLDICGQCHSGSFSLIGDAFTYRPGEDLGKYHKLRDPDFEGVGGIHTSNQLTRLSRSKCFQSSEMTCTSCHDPHQNQRGDTAVFTRRCLECHQPAHCGMSDQLGDKVAANCVTCHMPKGDNEGMTLRVSQGKFTVTMIDHYIRVDKKASEAYLAD